MDTKIIEQLKEAFAEEFSLVQHNLGELEQVVMQKIQLLGRGNRRDCLNVWLTTSQMAIRAAKLAVNAAVI